MINSANFGDLFSGYIDTVKFAQLFSAEVLLSLDREKRELNLEFKYKNQIDTALLDSLKAELKSALKLNKVSIKTQADPPEFSVELMPQIIAQVKKHIPAANGFLEDSYFRIDGDKLTITLTHGGEDILKAHRCGGFISKLIQERFGQSFVVGFDGETKMSADNSVLKKMQSKAEQKTRQNRLEDSDEGKAIRPHKIVDGLPLRFETAKPIYGDVIKKVPKGIKDISFDDGNVVVWGDVFSLDVRVTKDKRSRIISFNITDYQSSYSVKIFERVENTAGLLKEIENDMTVIVRGTVIYDSYKKEYIIEAKAVSKVKKVNKQDSCPEKRVELHLHTNMSALDGIANVKKIVAKAAQYGHKAIAITDHGVLQAYPDAMKAGSKHGVKIIYGVESYFLDDTNLPQGKTAMELLKEKKIRTYHQIILVKNEDGLKNLYKLVSTAHTHNFYKRPIIMKSELIQHREGLILGTACEAGELYRAVLNGESDERIVEIAQFYDYLEIQPNGNNMFHVKSGKVSGLEELENINRKIIALGDRLKKPVVATCDVHFLNEEDAVFRAILMAGQG
ncbi:MAG: PHP domain-containing protein, partial [Oscillospiraceae bacterium]|nr:PHP domain-containing protein [Oscillospiraceae bacterium]